MKRKDSSLILSPKSDNRKTGLCVLCPATRQAKGYAFVVEISSPDGSTSVVLADHVRNVDWKARNVQLVHRVSDVELLNVVAFLREAVIQCQRSDPFREESDLLFSF